MSACRSRWATAIVASLIGCGAGSIRTSADEVSLAPGKVPAVVRQAADRAMPGVRWTDATRETEGRTVTYELEGTNREDDDVSVLIDAAGRVIETCIEVDLSEVPRVVKNALRAAMPGIKVREVMSVSQAGTITGYDFDSRHNGKDIVVFVSLDGKTVELDD